MDLHQNARLSRRTVLRGSLVASAAAASASAWPGLFSRAAAQTPVSATPTDLDQRFRALADLVTARMAELQVPGVAVGVILEGREHAAGFGITNLDHPLPVDAATLFQIGSTSKTYTGTALMRLVEQGKVDLDASVRTYLPEFRVADEAVSEQVLVRHLVMHTAGWYGDDFTETGDGDDALEAFVAGMADLPQIAPLGRYFSYNNAALSVAGRVIEVVTGQTYEAAIGELVLQPLGLEENFFFPKEIMTKAFAVGHAPPEEDPEGAPIVSEPWALPRAVHPAGGIISNISDQLRYARFHLGDGMVDGTRVLSAESMRQMQQPLGPGGALGPLVLDGAGVTWLLTTIGGEPVVMHGGSTYGQQSTFLLVPGRGFAITVLTNADAGAILADEVMFWALEQYLGLQLPTPSPIAVDPTQLADYVADYDFGGGVLISVGEGQGELTLDVTADGEPMPDGSGPLPLVAVDRAAFDLAGITYLTDFVRDDAGQVGWVRFSGRLARRLE